MKNDQDQMTEERGAVPKTSYAGGKFDPPKNVRGGDRKIRGTDADRKAISRAEIKSRAKKSAMMQHLVPARPHGKNSRLRRVQSLPLKAISQQQNPVMVPPNLA